MLEDNKLIGLSWAPQLLSLLSGEHVTEEASQRHNRTVKHQELESLTMNMKLLKLDLVQTLESPLSEALQSLGMLIDCRETNLFTAI
ncbi:hypothetical protein L1987_34998 [Smallanthus sonchifolius]|uniref:Uncharacterized protein n=1 Tax=Smallanthus sonchifolius TaxID=185202 RepID=A0ACB9HVE4_9ASTR|nr:hypothetical protein L1987_34998 [Smallanthus sonchifolius]